VHIHSMTVNAQANAAGVSDLRLYAAPALPTVISPANAWMGGQSTSTNGVLGSSVQNLMNVTIPPNWGLYLVCNNTGTVPPQLIYSQVCFEINQ
jgi:hypothetical protein